MSKLFKILFNRVTIVVLLLILQVSFIIFFLIEASEYFVYLNWIFLLISFVYIIKLMRREVSPTLKIPVSLLLVIFPFIGIFLYYFSVENKLRKKFANNIKKQTFTLESLYMENNDIKDKLSKENKNIYQQSSYIANCTFLPAYQNNYTKYFPSGEEFFCELIEDLKTAKSFIFLEFFIIGNGKLWNSILDILKQKVNEGVEIRVIFDDVGSLKSLPYKYNKKLEALGIKCIVFNPISPIISLIHNNRDHKKIAVIDGQISYTGGLNIADEYINEKPRFGHWKDTGIKIVGESAKSFTLTFLESWHYFRDSAEDCSIYLNVPKPLNEEYHEGYVQPYISDPISENNVALGVYLNIINSATDYIYFTTPYFIIDSDIQSALVAASKRGVSIKIITPHIPDKKYIFRVTQSYYRPLLKHGIKFYEYEPGFMHAKVMISDDKVATVGTVNFDSRSFYHNYECGVWLYNTNTINDIKNDLEDSFSKSIEVTNEYIDENIGIVKRFIGEVLKLFAPLF